MAGLPPLRQRPPEAVHSTGISGPVEVAVDLELPVPLPAAAPQPALVPQHDVHGEAKRQVILRPGELELMVAGEREDVVPDDVLFPVMLVVAAGGGAVNEVAL